VAGLESCAHVEAPPGGPPDSIPPILIAVVPDSYAVVPGFDDYVRFEFNESISEQNLQVAAMLYPFEARPKVRKGKRELRVQPRAGWVPDRIYHIRVEPVIRDLFNNTIEQPIHHVISTGLPMPANAVQGTVFDPITGRALAGGRVEWVLQTDTIRYGSIADTVGAYRVAILPPGDYYAIGYEDVNNNQRVDAFDRSDTIQVSLGDVDTLTLEFQVFKHDTLGPFVQAVTPIDSMFLELGFDSYLDPETPLSVASFEVFALEDSTPLAIDTVFHFWQYTAYRDSLDQERLAAEEAALDSIAAAAAADTGAAPTDSAPAAEAAREERRAGRPAERVEVLEQVEEPQEPAILPDQRVYLLARDPIPGGTYVVRVLRLPNLSGLVADSETSWEQPLPVSEMDELEPEEQQPPEAPPDTASAGRRR